MLDGGEVRAYGNMRRELLFDLAHDGLLRGFARLHLAARKLPAVFEIAVSALRGENLAVSNDEGGNNIDGFHGSLLSGDAAPQRVV